MRTLILVLVSLSLALQSIFSQWQTFYVGGQNVYFHDVCVVNQNIIWAFGKPNSIVYKSTNGGISWIDVSPNITFPAGYTITALDENYAWITTDNERRIYRTTSGGLNWIEQLYFPSSIGFTISEIHFFNQNTGVFLNNTSNLMDTTYFYITRNGGSNWYASPNILLTTLLITKCFGAIDTNFMWLTDENKVYTLSGGLDNQWQVHSVDTLNPYLLISYFINSNTGYVGDGGVATNGLKIFKTINGGVNWALCYSDTTRIGVNNLIFAPNTNMAFLNGQFNIRVSRDTALTWIYSVKYPYNPLDVSMYYMDAYDTNSVWIAANKGRLFKYNINFIGVSPASSNIPAEYKLYQNYPNPFNPVTKIKFALPVQSDFSVKVYDIIGREVYSIADTKKAGEYEFTFDGTTFTSGIYFYQLQAGNFLVTKKMILLK